jgi:hypothetical protein
MATWLAGSASKRWWERFLLEYSLVWIAAIVAVTATGVFRRWGDVGYLALGVGVALPIWLAPALSPSPAVGIRFNLWVGLFSFLQVYFGSALFFDVLGMQYHFPVRWVVNRSPLFLYFMTVAYFSTYYVAMGVAWRRLGARRWALVPLGYVVAFAETATMANDWLRDYFSYKNKTFVLLLGSLFYGTVFVVSLPLVFRLDENPARRPPSARRIAWDVLAANMLILICYEIYSAVISQFRGS